jgi:adenylate cyclase class 2
MKTEIEAKFLDVNHDAVRRKLKEAGALCEQPMRLMRRVTFDSPVMKQKGGWIRVRDEGHRVTMTYKQVDKLEVDGVQEIEVTVSDFDGTVAIMRESGLGGNSFQESKRETWRIDDVEIELDEWPWLKPYIELEGASEEALHDVAAKLGLKWKDAKFGDVMVAYRAQYTHLTYHDTVGNLAEVRFDAPLPDLLKPAAPVA